MKEKETSKLYNSITNVNNRFIEEAQTKVKKKKNSWLKWGAMVACFFLVVVGVFDYVNKAPSSNVTQYGVLAEVVEVLDEGRYEVKVTGEDENFAIGDIVIINYGYTDDGAEESPLKTGDIIAITYSAFEKNDMVYEITPGQIEIVPNGSYTGFEELDVDYTTNNDGTYTYKDNIYKYKIEVSGIEGESRVTFIVLTNDTEISFEEVSYSLKKAEIKTGVPEFVVLGWH